MRHAIFAATLFLATTACFGGSDAGESTPAQSVRDRSDPERQPEATSNDPSSAESGPSLRDIARQAGSAIDEMRKRADQPVAEPVDFRKLRELLPDRLVDLNRTEAQGEKRQVMGSLGISQASASYDESDGDESASLAVEIQIWVASAPSPPSA